MRPCSGTWHFRSTHPPNGTVGDCRLAFFLAAKLRGKKTAFRGGHSQPNCADGADYDEKFTDEGLEHKDSRTSGLWAIAGDPREKLKFQFGPLSADCKKDHNRRFWSVVGSHYDFWIPFSLTAYIFAPIMGMLFYCMLKGSDYFGTCMDRMFSGVSTADVIRQMYGGKPDPWAGRSPVDDDR